MQQERIHFMLSRFITQRLQLFQFLFHIMIFLPLMPKGAGKVKGGEYGMEGRLLP
jgi:uncharacterized membrane protein (DUF4010 family)